MMICSNYLGRRIMASNSFIRHRQSSIDMMDPIFGACMLLSNSAAIQKPISPQQLVYRTYSIFTHGGGTLISSNTDEEQCIKLLHQHKIASLQCINNKHGSFNKQTCVQLRSFHNVSQYHDVADDTLHGIQDAVEDLIEDNCDTEANSDDEIPETNYSSGVLTLSFPPHGTWVINKQTPNQQLWWSSPLSGPRRYEYVEERERWVYTRVIEEGNDTKDSVPIIENDEDTLGNILKQELKKLYGWNLDVDA